MKNILNIAKYLTHANGRTYVRQIEFNLAISLLEEPFFNHNIISSKDFMDILKLHISTETLEKNLKKYENSIVDKEKTKKHFFKGITIYDMIKQGENLNITTSTLFG
ncbi:MAG: hypothetical protein J6U11_03995, partial [Campylobacter sp.]|nr:hypothetical protein [Campylobacter sp.]